MNFFIERSMKGKTTSQKREEGKGERRAENRGDRVCYEFLVSTPVHLLNRNSFVYILCGMGCGMIWIALRMQQGTVTSRE